MSALEDDFSEEDQKKSDAFSDYLDETCPELNETGESDSGGGGSSDAPSAEPSETS
jgi:hypothetical protein